MKVAILRLVRESLEVGSTLQHTFCLRSLTQVLLREVRVDTRCVSITGCRWNERSIVRAHLNLLPVDCRKEWVRPNFSSVIYLVYRAY